MVRNMAAIAISIALLLLASEGIVASVIFFSRTFNFSIALIGILIVGLGNALSEIFFSIQAARRKESWMVIGDLMGAVILPATLVLGIVAICYRSIFLGSIGDLLLDFSANR